MSWLVRSLTSPFQDQQQHSKNNNDNDNDDPLENVDRGETESSNPKEDERGGMKEDLSELTNTLKRQLWGVAQFIAPPPAVKSDDPLPEKNDAHENSNPDGIRTDISHLSVRVRSGFSRISSVIQSLAKDEDESEEEDDDFSGSAKPVDFKGSMSEISRFASSFLPSNLGKLSEEGENSVVGLTDEVASFVANVTQHPGTWLDFPLNREDGDDFDMSDVQQEHALAVEHYVPSLAALRIELCPGYMSENRFWMIYFVLIHPRLNKEDVLLLSTPQILEARALLSQELQRRNMTESSNDGRGLDSAEGTSSLMPQEQKYGHVSPIIDNHEKAESIESVSLPTSILVTTDNVEGDHQQSSSSGTSSMMTPSKELSVQNEDAMSGMPNRSNVKHDDEDQEVEDWLQEDEDGNEAPASSGATHLEHEEDVSFSDLEDDDDT